MDIALLPTLARWANFHVIVGSSAGALTGLQFVVITLIAQAGAASSRRAIRAFGTPTVVHFCAALVISAVMNMPWQAIWHLAFCLGGLAGIGLAYSVTVIVHARKQTGYIPDFSDWIWYTSIPVLTYLMLASAAILVWRNLAWSLFLIAGIDLLFLFVGIRNAWDTVTHIALQHSQRAAEHAVTSGDREHQG